MWSGPVIIIAIIIIIAMSKQLTILNLERHFAKGLGQNITLDSWSKFILNYDISGGSRFNGRTNCLCWLDGTSHCQILSRYRLFKGITINSFNRRFTYDFSDTVARMLGEAPVGAIISFIGVPYLYYLVKKRRTHNMIHPKLRRKQIVTFSNFFNIIISRMYMECVFRRI